MLSRLLLGSTGRFEVYGAIGADQRRRDDEGDGALPWCVGGSCRLLRVSAREGRAFCERPGREKEAEFPIRRRELRLFELERPPRRVWTVEKYLNGLFRSESLQSSMGNDVAEPAVQGIVETKLRGENVLTTASLRVFFAKSRPAALSSSLNLECTI